MHYSSTCLRYSLTLTTMVGMTASGWAIAQNTLEEVLVTAQKRVENVQDIPVTINVLTGDILDNFSIRDTNDLAASVPGLTIQHTPQNLSQVTMRGIGTGAGGESLDQSVGLFIDGVWAGRIREFQAALFDVERVEVIKGTQTALLGKNTSLGAISIISRRPTDEFGGYIQGDYELEFDSTFVTAAVDIPTGFGNYRLAINSVQEEGYVTNQTTGNEVPEREQNTIRLSADYDVTENGSLLISYQYDELEILGDTFQPDNDELGFIASIDPTALIGISQGKTALTSEGSSGDAQDQQDSQRATINYDHSFGDYQFTSLTGWTEYDNTRLTDSDFLTVDYLNTLFSSEYEQVSQEFRIASPSDRQFSYIAGLYYMDSTLDYTAATNASFPEPFTLSGLPLDGDNTKIYTQDTEVWSLFGQSTLTLGERWRATVGLRYTDEQKDAVWERVRTRSGRPGSEIVANLLAPEVPPTPLERGEDNLDGSINIQYDLSEDTMTYLSWARGSKSGGFTTEVALPEDAEYDTEKADTTEIGLKMEFADGAALLNVAAFYTQIENFQIITFTGLAFLTDTVPAETQGIEIEGRIAARPNLVLGASATFADAEQTDIDMRLPYAPEWSAAFNAHYELPWNSAGMNWLFDGALNLRDEQYQQRDERSLDGALTLLDLRIALASGDDSWEVALMGRNLLDQESSFGFDYPAFGGQTVPIGTATVGSLNRPRTIALQGRYKF
ncbi:MAG: iron complex outermembrane receptor protein [Halioglobus sp.]|jgi:iron complex outermembrane receptor protein